MRVARGDHCGRTWSRESVARHRLNVLGAVASDVGEPRGGDGECGQSEGGAAGDV
jgi:hypothetical protein